jgi:hypothetical protein
MECVLSDFLPMKAEKECTDPAKPALAAPAQQKVHGSA